MPSTRSLTVSSMPALSMRYLLANVFDRSCPSSFEASSSPVPEREAQATGEPQREGRFSPDPFAPIRQMRQLVRQRVGRGRHLLARLGDLRLDLQYLGIGPYPCGVGIVIVNDHSSTPRGSSWPPRR